MDDDLIVNILDWNKVDKYDKEDDKSKLNIELYGKTINNESIFITVTNFTPYFFIELNEEIFKSNNDIKKLKDSMKSLLGYKIYYNLIKCDIIDKHKLYGFTAEKNFKFLRLIFNTSYSMSQAAYKLKNAVKISGINNNSPIKLNLYESNIEPILRMMHHTNIKSTGWIIIDDYEELDINSNSDICIKTSYKNIKPYDKIEIHDFSIMSFDIECTSCDGGFPQACRDGDKIIQIGSTFNRLGNKKCYYKSMITLNSCDPIEGVDVISCRDEKQLISEWCKMVLNKDPDIITGWNIFGFDEKYIYDRAIKLGLDDEVAKLARQDKSYKFIEKSLSSSALGDNKLYYFNMVGRVQIDLMKVVQRDYNLDSYKLDSVAEEFINGKILEKKIKKRAKKTELKITNVDDIIVGNFIKLSVPRGKFDTEYYENGIKLKIIKIDQDVITIDHVFISNDFNNSKNWNWGLVKDDIKPNDIFRLQEGSSADRKLVAEYCIQDCILCNKLMEKLCILINNIAMANVCSVPLSYIFLRGQGIKITSLVAKFCREKNYLMPVLENKKDQGYEGAIVFPPDIGFYEDPIAVLDYASLYPSSMIHRNLSHEMFVDIGGEYDNLSDYIYRNITFTNSDKTETTCRFAKKKDGSLGLMPTILDHLLSQRKAVKKQMKQEKDPFKNSILDGQQLAFKLSANSLYGQIGSSFSTIYKKHIAASTTATGRYMLELARDYMENDFPVIVNNIYKHQKNKRKLNAIFKKELKDSIYKNKEKKEKILASINKILDNCNIYSKSENDLYVKTVYGDTDSVFINFNFIDKTTNEKYKDNDILEFAIDLGLVAGDLIKSRLEFPHNLEYEKTFYPFAIFSKKRYVGNKYEFDYNKFKQNSMGIVLKRRDNAPIVKEIIGGIVDILLNEINIPKSIKYMDECINKLLNGNYPIKYFITSKTLKATYADRSRIPHVCLADRITERDPGNAPNTNDRIPYVAIIIDDKKILSDKIKKNNILLENSIKEFKKINIVNIKEFYEKFKGNEKDIDLIDEFRLLLGYQEEINNILPKNIYDKIYKEFYKFLEKIEPYQETISNDEIKLKLHDIFIKFGNDNVNIIQGDRVEHPEYIIEQQLDIDYNWYLTNQIMNPASQFYSLIIEKIYGFNELELDNYDLNNEDDRCKIAEKLIFEKFLIKDKENKKQEKENEKDLKNNNKNIIFKNDLEIINKVKKDITKKTRKKKETKPKKPKIKRKKDGSIALSAAEL